jgi:hypothetical protein
MSSATKLTKSGGLHKSNTMLYNLQQGSIVVWLPIKRQEEQPVKSRVDKSRVDIGDNYYTGREVQRLLGITEPKLRTLVANKTLRKVIPPGYKTGRYLKKEVDAFAEKWEAFLLAKELPKTTFVIAKPEDMEDEQELAERSIGPGLSAEARRKLVTANPESDYHVRYNDKLVALLHLTALKHETMMKLVNFEISWDDIRPEDIERYEPGKPLELFITAIASDPDVDEQTRMGYMLHLLRGAARELKKLGERGVIITKVYGRSNTPTGIAAAIHMGMIEQGPRRGKTISFVMDTKTNQSYLARMYSEGLAEWQKQQRTNRTNRMSLEQGKTAKNT